MAFWSQIEVKVDGKSVGYVLYAKFGLEVSHDMHGSPSDARPRLARICFARPSDDSKLLADWSAHPVRGNFKSGKIIYYTPDEKDKVQCTVEWKDGFIARYMETVPDINASRSEPMSEYVEISAQSIKVNGVEVQADTWK